MRHGIKAFGLSLLAALCLTAVMASGAQALLINGGEFLTNEGTFKELGVSSETLTGQEVNPGTGSVLVLGLELSPSCESIHLLSGQIKALGHGEGKLLFLECQVFDEAGESAGCVPFDVTADVLALVFLHGNVSGKTHHPYVLFEPAGGGTVFASIEPEECLVPAAEVEGSAVAEITNNPLGHVEKPRMAINPGAPSLFPEHALFYGENEAHVSAEVEGWLTGALEGEAWGVS